MNLILQRITGLGSAQRVELLARLRDARYLVLKDAEAFHEAATTLEYVGQVICGEIRNGLAHYSEEIVGLALQTGRHEENEVCRLFKVVREARNKAVHVGAFARHLNSRLIDLVLILEEAIMAQMLEIQDLMVRSPFVAEPWQLIGHVRNTMLANSFSSMPIRVANEETSPWMILTDTAVMRIIQAVSRKERDARLNSTVEQATREGLIRLEPAICVRPGEPIATVVGKLNHLPILVVETSSNSRLLGIITSFDLL